MTVLETAQVADGIIRITLNRPETLNALNKRLLRAIATAVRSAGEDDVRVLIVEGAGNAFCAGADLDEASEEGEDIELYQDVTRAIRSFDGVVIGKLHGHAIGGGMELALAFDLRYAAKETTFRLPEAEHGYIIAGGSSRLLRESVGDGLARELVFTGRELTAGEAADVGLVSRSVPSDQLESTVQDVAADIAAMPPLGIELNKQVLNNAQPIESELEYERLRHVERDALARD